MCLATVAHSVTVDAYRNLEGVARQQTNGNLLLYNKLVTRTKACIMPGLHFFQRKFSQEFHGLIHAFKSARLCCPVQVQQLRPNAASVEELSSSVRNFSFLDVDTTIADLVHQLPHYLEVADGTDIAEEEKEKKVQWWARHKRTLLNWPAVVRKLLLVQQSSATAERVFSLMKHLFTDQQENALQETVEASGMLRYNGKERRNIQ